MTVEQILIVISLFLQAGLFGLGLKLNYKWNTVLDRLDILWREYAKQHDIPFKGLKNDFED